ncbi:MAG: sugar-binding protein [Planctomycetota bacterium]
MRPTSSLLAFGATLILAACGTNDKYPGAQRFAYVTNGVDPFWTIAEVGAKKAGDDLKVNVLVEMPAQGISHQKQILEDLLTRGVDGIAVSPIDHLNQTEQLDALAGKVTLITHDSDAPNSKRVAFVGMDNYDAGRMAGELVREALPQGGKVMLFVGRLEQDNARLRREGLLDAILQRERDAERRDPPESVLAGAGFEVLGTRTDQFDKSVAKANAADALTAHPDLDGMVGLFAYNAPAILEALKQAGKLGKVKVVGFDEADGTLQGIVDGRVYGTVVQNPYDYGYKSVVLLAALKRGDKSLIGKNGRLEVPARQIRRDTVEAFWADLKRKLGKQ